MTAFIRSFYEAECSFYHFRHSLPGDAGSCFNEETGVLEAPVTIQIADNVSCCWFFFYPVDLLL